MKIIFIIVILLVVGGYFVSSQTERPAAPNASEGAAPTIEKTAEMQSQRDDFINNLISEGVIDRIEVPGTLPRVWVTPHFYTLDFQTKQRFISVVFAYYFDGYDPTDSVRVFDNMSGKEIAVYSTVDGGLRIF